MKRLANSGAGVVLAAAVFLNACTGSPALVPPSEGGPSWVRLESKHITLMTDLDVDDGKRVVAGFERTYELLHRAVFGDAAGSRGSYHPCP
jgi:hypothetical protein